MPKSREDKENDVKNDRTRPDSIRPSEEAIAKRAYELYLQRGSTPGYELDNWLEAEAQLIAESNEQRRTETTGQADVGEGAVPAARGTGRRRESGTGSSRRAARP
jgi:hypothetical protein